MSHTQRTYSAPGEQRKKKRSVFVINVVPFHRAKGNFHVSGRLRDIYNILDAISPAYRPTATHIGAHTTIHN